MALEIDINIILEIARAAGKEILKVYHQEADFEVTLKTDDSPLTKADQLSNDAICKGLERYYPQFPILSEEGKDIPYGERKGWSSYWCVDPLDGTKEFIKRNGEFTVNIALIRDREPVLGVIYIPVKDIMYYADEHSGSWKQINGTAPFQIKTSNKTEGWIAAASRSHGDPEEQEILAKYPIVETITAGSSLKFCLLAEGTAQIYLRKGPTMEWDTAAGHAIAKFSGCTLTLLTGEPFLYNKKSLLNDSFLCKQDLA